MSSGKRHSHWRKALAAIGEIVVVAVAYLVAAKLGLLLSVLGGNVTAFWPASGIAVAAAVILGRRALLGVWVGQFAVTFTAFRAGHDDLALAAAIIMSACMALAGVTEAAVGAWSVRRFSVDHPLSSRRALFWFILWACIVGGAVAATIGTATLGVGGACPAEELLSTWFTWWLGDMMGALIVGPPLLVWFFRAPTLTCDVIRRRWWYLEFIAAEMLLLATTLLAFDLLPWQTAPHAPLTFLIGPGLIWLTIRFDLHGATAAVATLAFLAVTATVLGRGPFIADDLAGSLLVLQAFIATLTVTFLTLAASSAQQRRAETALSYELEQRVHARTVELAVVNEELRTEVAERRRTEQQLRQQEQLFRQVLEALPVGVVVADPSGQIIRDNPAMERIWGPTRGTALADFSRFSARWGDTGAPVQPHEYPLARAIQNRCPCLGRLFSVNAIDGSKRAILLSAAPIDGEAGEFLGGVAVGEDVTDRVKSEQRLASSERFARAIIDALAAQLIILDSAGTIVAVNAAWRRYMSDHNLPGEIGASYLTIYETVTDVGIDDVRAIVQGIRSVLNGGRAEFHLEYRRHDGIAEQWFALGVRRFNSGPDEQVLVKHENITDRVLAERLQRERVSLREAVDAMEQVLGVVGHELRTPLAALRAISEFLVTDGARATAQWDHFLHEIGDEVDRMADTVNNLLEAARLNSGRARWNWGPIDLSKTCEDALESIRPLVSGTSVDLSLQVEPVARSMLGDADAIRRLTMNLLSNARKHTSTGNIWIRIAPGNRSQDHARWVELSVEDTGSGISPEILARLGQAFALNSGVVGTNHIGGTGLGLAICKGIAAAHGGYIEVSSVAGQGTTITAHLRADLSAAADGDTQFVSEREAILQ